MRGNNEQQKYVRYKYGYYSLIILVILLFLNEFFTSVFNFQWGEEKYVEIFFIISIVLLIFSVLSTYHFAFFRKDEDVSGVLWMYFLLGSFNVIITLLTTYLYPGKLLEQEKFSRDISQLLTGIIFLSIPITYYVRKKVDQKKVNK